MAADRLDALGQPNFAGAEQREPFLELVAATSADGLDELLVAQRQQLEQASLSASAVLEPRPEDAQQPASP